MAGTAMLVLLCIDWLTSQFSLFCKHRFCTSKWLVKVSVAQQGMVLLIWVDIRSRRSDYISTPCVHALSPHAGCSSLNDIVGFHEQQRILPSCWLHPQQRCASRLNTLTLLAWVHGSQRSPRSLVPESAQNVSLAQSTTLDSTA